MSLSKHKLRKKEVDLFLVPLLKIYLLQEKKGNKLGP